MQRQTIFPIISSLATLGALFLSGSAGAAAPAKPVSFQKQVQPILARRRQGCHQSASQGGKLVVISYTFLKAGGMSGPAFRPGEPDKSPLIQYVGGPEPKMPKGGPPLPAAEVSLRKTRSSTAARTVFRASTRSSAPTCGR